MLSAQREVHKTFSLCNFSTKNIGISYIDELPNSFWQSLKMNVWFIFSLAALIGLVAGETAYVTSLLVGSTSVAEFVASLHIVGYGMTSISKCLTIWRKKHKFRHLVNELVEIWPVTVEGDEADLIKMRSLGALRLGQLCYMFWNIFGVSMYIMTPLTLYILHLIKGQPSDLGYVWYASYPFDKTKPLYHELVFIFEAFAGVVSVWATLGSDMMFSCMASHISMLLRVLQVKIRALNSGDGLRPVDNYEDIVSVIKIHQRLIRYSKDLEEVFSMVNLINVLLSSVGICCVVFNIVLIEPWIEISNKFFLGAVLTQIGILCWYADDVAKASVGVLDAVYESGWYKSNWRCRRALILLLRRSQKPLCFTALKFRNITMNTYTSILTTSYSYFTLLYTMYRD